MSPGCFKSNGISTTVVSRRSLRRAMRQSGEPGIAIKCFRFLGRHGLTAPARVARASSSGSGQGISSEDYAHVRLEP
jgi:hypothetical protein